MVETDPVGRQGEQGLLRAERGIACSLPIEDVAGRLLRSATKVAYIEAGVRRSSPRDVCDLMQRHEVGQSDEGHRPPLASSASRAKCCMIRDCPAPPGRGRAVVDSQLRRILEVPAGQGSIANREAAEYLRCRPGPAQSPHLVLPDYGGSRLH
jgi:hypothetical protein